MGGLVTDLVARVAGQSADAIALVYEGRTLRYAELVERVERVAARLVAAGAGPDRVVGVIADSRPELVVSILATLWAGAAYLPLDPAYPRTRLQRMVESARPIAILDCVGARLDDAFWRADDRRILDVASLQHEGPRADRKQLHPQQLAYVVFTSGSTGNPKGVMITHAGLVPMIEAQIELFAIRPDSRVLQFASFSFDASVSEVFSALVAGAQLHLAPRSAMIPGEPLLRTLREQRISVVTLPPSVLATLPATELPDLATVVSAGEACSAAVVERWARGRRFVNAYGPSEATVCATGGVCEIADRPPSIGPALPHVRVYVLDDQLAPVAPGGTGELYIAGQSLARGYIDLPAQTAAAFVPDPFSDRSGSRMYRTGDIVELDERGALRYLSRVDHQVKIRGYRIELGEIEHVLRAQPGVQDALAVTWTDSQGDRQIVAYAIPRDIDGDDVRAKLRGSLPEFMVPTRVIGLDAWPLSPNGKIDRAALPRPDCVIEVNARTYVAPRDSVELALVGVWEALLGRAPIGIDDDFFALGGHSLLAVRLVQRLRDELGASCRIETLAEHPTISRLARHLQSPAVTPSPAVLLHDGAGRPPLFLAPPVHGSPLCYVPLARLLSPSWRCYGLRAPGMEGEMTPPATVDDIAAHYVAIIRELQPQGPYAIGGWSMGGIIAHEIARQLEQAGAKVAFLALIEATVVSSAHCEYFRAVFGDFKPSLTAYIYVRNLAVSLGKTVELKRDHYEGWPLDAIHADIAKRLCELEIVTPTTPLAEVIQRFDVFCATFYSMYQYPLRQRPRYRGEAVVFSSEAGHPFMPADAPNTTWREFIDGNIEDRVVAGDHYTVLLPANVRRLAAELSAALRARVTR